MSAFISKNEEQVCAKTPCKAIRSEASLQRCCSELCHLILAVGVAISHIIHTQSEGQPTPGAYTVSVTLPKLRTCVTEFETDSTTDLFQVQTTCKNCFHFFAMLTMNFYSLDWSFCRQLYQFYCGGYRSVSARCGTVQVK